MDTAIQAARLRSEIQELKEEIASCEVRALLPPADCSMPAVYIEAEHERIQVLNALIRVKQAEIDVLEGQMLLPV